MFNSLLINNIIKCLYIYLALRHMIFQSNWTSFERKKSPVLCLHSLFFLMLVNTGRLDCLFLILPAEMKSESGTKDQLCAFCFPHPNILLYFCIHRVCVISSHERQLSSSVPTAISALPVEKPRRSRAVAEKEFEYPYLTLQTTEDTQNHVWDKMPLKFQSLDLCLAVLQKWAAHNKRGILIDSLPSGALK